MARVAASAVRATFSDTVNRVTYTGERVVLEKHGKAIAAIVSKEDLDLLELLEDKIDLAAARRALRDPKRHKWEDVKAELGL